MGRRWETEPVAEGSSLWEGTKPGVPDHGRARLSLNLNERSYWRNRSAGQHPEGKGDFSSSRERGKKLRPLTGLAGGVKTSQRSSGRVTG